MPDGLVFYLAVLFSEQFTLLLVPVEGDAFAQPHEIPKRQITLMIWFPSMKPERSHG
ncbi:MAG: hypothetical protein J6X55_05165 [Victivallales bacterium]|nr:hypothetical protein [Victivallales bacterium]